MDPLLDDELRRLNRNKLFEHYKTQNSSLDAEKIEFKTGKMKGKTIQQRQKDSSMGEIFNRYLK